MTPQLKNTLAIGWRKNKCFASIISPLKLKIFTLFFQTLRKSATKSEKEEFLKEALLMSNFHHEHILGLLGVCLDNDPQFLILELMEGSDLLSFLRNCRATSVS